MTSGIVDWKQICQNRQVIELVTLALEEDIGPGDVTTAAIFTQAQKVRAQVIAKTATLVCGLPLAEYIFRRLDPTMVFSAKAIEGQNVSAGQVLCECLGDVRAILAGERCVLNFLMHLCGVANNARKAVEALPEGSATLILDTRKTIPGFRVLDKAAIRTGGAQNHRMGLFDEVLIKDNHVAAAGGVAQAVKLVRQALGKTMTVEVEVDHLNQIEPAINAGADIVLLDNFSDAQVAEAVRLVAGRIKTEVSGGIKRERIPSLASIKLDRISIGALTHTVTPPDLSLEILDF